MDSAATNEYKTNLKRDAEKLLLEGFPRIILQLNSLLDTPKFKKNSFEDIHVDLSTRRSLITARKRRCQGETLQAVPQNPLILTSVSSNPHIIDLVDTVKPHMVKLMEDAKLIKIWISLLVPKIEDGNNFGVEIQEDIITLVRNVEEMGIRFFSTISSYFEKRAKIVKNLTRYPQVEDFKKAVHELDEREYCGLCLVLVEIRNCYTTMHDVLIKNLERIKRPRADLAAGFLYGAA